jgi:hypothetical protein
VELAKKNLSIQEQSGDKIIENLEKTHTIEACCTKNMALKGAALQNYNSELVHRMMQHFINHTNEIMKQ